MDKENGIHRGGSRIRDFSLSGPKFRYEMMKDRHSRTRLIRTKTLELKRIKYPNDVPNLICLHSSRMNQVTDSVSSTRDSRHN